mmetsp:Transcript_46229/g.122555  ORF Transcript_46229/g.122555 Transcript_46229/m.122555 type:complete len:234 (-) Transcript_46229:1450-2151(-)
MRRASCHFLRNSDFARRSTIIGVLGNVSVTNFLAAALRARAPFLPLFPLAIDATRPACVQATRLSVKEAHRSRVRVKETGLICHVAVSRLDTAATRGGARIPSRPLEEGALCLVLHCALPRCLQELSIENTWIASCCLREVVAARLPQARGVTLHVTSPRHMSVAVAGAFSPRRPFVQDAVDGLKAFRQIAHFELFLVALERFAAVVGIHSHWTISGLVPEVATCRATAPITP